MTFYPVYGDEFGGLLNRTVLVASYLAMPVVAPSSTSSLPLGANVVTVPWSPEMRTKRGGSGGSRVPRRRG